LTGEAGIDYVRRLAISMQQHDLKAFSPDEVLQADWLYASFQPERIADLATRLTAENLVLLVSAKGILPEVTLTLTLPEVALTLA
jgi:hypothetical protein